MSGEGDGVLANEEGGGSYYDEVHGGSDAVRDGTQLVSFLTSRMKGGFSVKVLVKNSEGHFGKNTTF